MREDRPKNASWGSEIKYSLLHRVLFTKLDGEVISASFPGSFLWPWYLALPVQIVYRSIFICFRSGSKALWMVILPVLPFLLQAAEDKLISILHFLKIFSFKKNSIYEGNSRESHFMPNQWNSSSEGSILLPVGFDVSFSGSLLKDFLISKFFTVKYHRHLLHLNLDCCCNTYSQLWTTNTQASHTSLWPPYL